MRKITIGSTSRIATVLFKDPSSTVGAGLVGLTYTNVTCSTVREGGTLSAQTLVTATAGTYTSNGFVATSTNAAGLYQYGVPTSIFASGSKSAVIYLKTTTGQCEAFEVELDAVNYQSANNFITGVNGFNATVGTPGGLAVQDAVGNVTTSQDAAESIMRTQVELWAVDTGYFVDQAPTIQIGGSYTPVIDDVLVITTNVNAWRARRITAVTDNGGQSFGVTFATPFLNAFVGQSDNFSDYDRFAIISAVDVRLAGSFDTVNAGVSSLAAGQTTIEGAITALQTAVGNLNNLSALANLYGPPLLEIPDSGTTQFPFTLIVRDSEGHLVNLDANPTLTAANAAGTDRSGNLSAVSHPAAGRYTFTYGVTSAAAEEGIRISASGAVSSSARYVEWAGAVVNYDSLTTLAAIVSKTNLIGTNAADSANAVTAQAATATLVTGQNTISAAVAAGNTNGVALLQMTTGSGSGRAFTVPALANAPTGGGGSGIAGPGANPCTIILTEDGTSGTPAVAQAEVWITSDSAGVHVVAGTLATDSQGAVKFLLTTGNTYYLWARKDGWAGIQGASFTAVAD